MTTAPLLIRNAQVGGVGGVDVRIGDGRIKEIGRALAGVGEELDARGGALIPGLIDHHIHLLAAAARAQSLSLENIKTAGGFRRALRQFAAARPAGGWLRVVGYHESLAGVLTREDIDGVVPDHPVRVQHQTGSLWMLNSLALEIAAPGETPDCVERDHRGRPTGRIWRGDRWLRGVIGKSPPALGPIGASLAAMGVVGVMDASVSTGEEEVAILADARRSGNLPQRLGLMSGGFLEPSDDDAFLVGPVKILLDEDDLPDLDDVVRKIGQARGWARAVAVHCVTAAELALALAAFDSAGSCAGDRIEHGGMIPPETIPQIARLGLTVVTQPGFIHARGDRYFDDVDPSEHDDLYRCASLLARQAPLAASSDAPYGPIDPWLAMRTAITRRTLAGRGLGEAERVTPGMALGLFLGDFARPGGRPRTVARDAPADLCLLRAPIREAMEAPSSEWVAATLVAGRVVFVQR